MYLAACTKYELLTLFKLHFALKLQYNSVRSKSLKTISVRIRRYELFKLS